MFDNDLTSTFVRRIMINAFYNSNYKLYLYYNNSLV